MGICIVFLNNVGHSTVGIHSLLQDSGSIQWVFIVFSDKVGQGTVVFVILSMKVGQDTMGIHYFLTEMLAFIVFFDTVGQCAVSIQVMESVIVK